LGPIGREQFDGVERTVWNSVRPNYVTSP
jgi:hypothetical protein